MFFPLLSLLVFQFLPPFMLLSAKYWEGQHLSVFRRCALFVSPVGTHNVASATFWQDNQKMVGPWKGNIVYYPIPLESQESQAFTSRFPTTCMKRASLSGPAGQVAGTQCLLEVHLLMTSLRGQRSFQKQCLLLWELRLQAIWAQTTLFLKL